ncbi:hypothetical protein HMPREF9337_01180 [Cutibacterium acnes HL096PA3]|uniref:Oxidoreductase n=1 Tax=Cutibacterium acnes TaxID=1747 RepID=A0A8B2VGR5_CUTAC|nr:MULTISPECIES: hypothetical protein [Cutibacterium]EGE73715.1 hypothetical protein HMPREF9337_01180 [Cutibacterium acnes HL096PA3]MCP3886352.1 oxidoreductase [Propionibacteriaceae bacterium]RHW03418.1 oxidoreductase [Propionibacterium sp. KPL2009]AVT26492.1 oxidoreductase [Cutibacterium acnes]AYW80562.1 oxidoreductase [Cutibacterium acnes]
MAVSTYEAAQDRYDTMEYRRCGTSGLLLPAVSLGLWHNFWRFSPRIYAACRAASRFRSRYHPLRPR